MLIKMIGFPDFRQVQTSSKVINGAVDENQITYPLETMPIYGKATTAARHRLQIGQGASIQMVDPGNGDPGDPGGGSTTRIEILRHNQ